MKNNFLIFFLTIFAIIFSYYFALFFHEWGHGTTAWILGYKSNPFAIHYGITRAKGWLLENVNENVDYASLMKNGHRIHAALIGISGIMANVIFALLSLLLLRISRIQRNTLWCLIVYWCYVLNLAVVAGYVYFLSFNSEGDIARFNIGLSISPWWVYIIGLFISFYGIYLLLRYEITKVYAFVLPHSLAIERSYLVLTLIILFYYPLLRGLLAFLLYGEPLISYGYKFHFGTVLSLHISRAIIAIILIIIFDPQKKFIQQTIKSR